MPCNCDHLEATELEKEISRMHCLVDEIKTGTKISKQHWDGYHPKVYTANANKLRDLGDQLTRYLCEFFKNKPEGHEKNYSLEMQMWVRDHKKVDESKKEKLLNHLKGTVSDLIADFLYYDRKEDEALKCGDIEDAILSGDITRADVISLFVSELKETLPEDKA